MPFSPMLVPGARHDLPAMSGRAVAVGRGGELPDREEPGEVADVGGVQSLLRRSRGQRLDALGQRQVRRRLEIFLRRARECFLAIVELRRADQLEVLLDHLDQRAVRQHFMHVGIDARFNQLRPAHRRRRARDLRASTRSTPRRRCACWRAGSTRPRPSGGTTFGWPPPLVIT